MTDFQFIEAKFSQNFRFAESSYIVRVIVHRDDVGFAIEKIVRFGQVLQFIPESVNVTCIMDINFILPEFLYKPRFSFNNTPGSFISSLNTTLNSFMSNFKKNLKKIY